MSDLLHEFARLIHLVLLLCGVVAVSGFLADMIVVPLYERLQERQRKRRRDKRRAERLTRLKHIKESGSSSCA